jgi:peroxiredoxin
MTLLIIFGMVLPWLLVGLAVWLGYQFLRQMGRVLLRLDALEQQLKQRSVPAPAQAPARPPAAPAGLPLAAEAPAFELPDLEGKPGTLAQYRGRKVLLIFFNPQCGFCTKMIPELAALPADPGPGVPVPLIVTTGKLEDNRRLFQEHAIRCPVLLQEQMTVASKYQVQGTPVGYLIDEHGKIASAMAIGKDALLQLSQGADTAAAGKEGQSKGKANRGLQASRINRAGLKAGTAAPAFRLPRLGGGELALEDFRGRRVLLVFSDPKCGPCDQLAPDLEKLHRQGSDVQILMIGRGDPEANRAKVTTLGLSFPVVLQRQWEISLLYGMFATPIGYLVNEDGILAADTAVGVEPILALLGVSAAAAASNNGEARPASLAGPHA